MERFDVAVVGAGPAGSASAVSLSRRGYSVVLIDRALFPREKLCGDFLNPINWPLFEKLGVADEVLSLDHERVGAFRISTFSGEEAAFPFHSGNGRKFFGLGLRRYYLDELLLRQAEKAGASVRQGSKVAGLARERDGWTLSLAGRDREERLSARFLIGADGRNSWVARRLDLCRPGEVSGWAVGFQLHLGGVEGVGGEVQIHLFPGGYAGLVGLGQGLANLCFAVKRADLKKAISIDELFERFLYKNPHLKEALLRSERAGPLRSAYPVYFSPRRSFGDGFLLVGDAARVTEPVTGEGIYSALKSGMLAAEAIDGAFKKSEFSAVYLARYGLACRKEFFLRRGINGIIRSLIYRPSLLRPLIRLSAKSAFPIAPLVDFVCQAKAPSH